MHFIGIDIGTTNTKAVLLDDSACIVDRLTIPSDPSSRDPETLWLGHVNNTLAAFFSRRALQNETVYCSITAQGGSFTVLDKQFRPLTPIHSWTDLAADPVAASFQQRFPDNFFYRLTGWQPHPLLMSAKLKQLVDMHQFPSAATAVVTVPDYILAALTGTFATDITNAQITTLCDFQNRCWHPDILRHVGIAPELLPDIISDLDIIQENLATPYGPLHLTTASHDQYALMQAVNLQADAAVMLGTGTAWVINARTTQPVYDDQGIMHPGRDLYPDQFGNIITMGPVGRTFEQYLAHLGLDLSAVAAVLDNTLHPSPPDEPIDINPAHPEPLHPEQPALCVLRYFQYTAARVRRILDLLDPRQRITSILMTGGAARSPLWPQVIADITTRYVTVIDVPELTALGAALHAQAAADYHCPPDLNTVTCHPTTNQACNDWYLNIQKPLLEKQEIGI